MRKLAAKYRARDGERVRHSVKLYKRCMHRHTRPKISLEATLKWEIKRLENDGELCYFDYNGRRKERAGDGWQGWEKSRQSNHLNVLKIYF